MFALTGKVALVTGGSRGIGRAVCKALATQGARVAVGYATGQDAAQQTVSEIEGAGGTASACQLDVSDMKSAEAGVSAVAKELGKLDILVANAGVSIDALLLRLKEEDLDRLLAVNLKGALACARAAIRPMMRAKSGRIIFVSSVVGETGNAGQAGYAATKAGLLGVSRSLAREYASRNITVNAVTPGYISTDMTGALNDKQREEMLTGIPLGRPGTPADIAGAVAYLASEEAAYMTGQTLRVNGGMYM